MVPAFSGIGGTGNRSHDVMVPNAVARRYFIEKISTIDDVVTKSLLMTL
jgi:hypothetical protein